MLQASLYCFFPSHFPAGKGDAICPGTIVFPAIPEGFLRQQEFFKNLKYFSVDWEKVFIFRNDCRVDSIQKDVFLNDL